MSKFRFRLGLSLWFLMSSVVWADPSHLTLQQYLKQVKDKHLGFQGSQLLGQGALERVTESRLLTSPSLFLNLLHQDDRKPTLNPSFAGTRTVFQNYSIGIAQQTSFGLSAKLRYEIARAQLFGTLPALVPAPLFYTASPILEVSQSLWRNGFGSETQATQEAAQAQTKATSLAETLKSKMLLAEAEGVYWRLAIARELVKVARDGVERAKRIKEWSSRRAMLSLGDKSDALQAEAGLQGKQLELQMDLDEERQAINQFNSMRGVDSNQLDENLQNLDPEKLKSLKPFQREGKREDVLAADEARKAAQAATQLGREKNSPSLDLISSYAFNGRRDTLGATMSDATNASFSTFSIGLKFSTPLELGLLQEDKAAYLKEEKGAELNYQRKLFEEQLEWTDLNTQFEEMKRRLMMAESIERVQKEKLLNEKERLKTGRSVLYQVLLFEQDYANAQIMVLRTQLQMLVLWAKMKTYLPMEKVASMEAGEPS